MVNLNGWLAERHIPSTRPGLAELLRAAGCDNPSELMFRSLGLSLSDQYWFHPEGADLRWEDVNFFQNAYVDAPHAMGGPDAPTRGLDRARPREDSSSSGGSVATASTTS